MQIDDEGRRAPASRRRWLCRALAAACLPAPHPVAAQAAAEQPVIEALHLGGSQLELQFAPGFDDRLRAEARTWVRRSGEAVAAYFGRFPVPQAEVLLTPVAGGGVGGGVTYGEPTLWIRIRLGRDTSRAQFAADWIMAHEMVHLAIPRVPRAQRWLHEGIATYVESVARGRAGLIAAAEVWQQWATAMPQGQPQPGDAGLDHTPSWGRTYWGGAMFCLLADVQLLTLSDGKAGLQQALQGVLAAGGNHAVAWPVQRILDTADAAVGQRTLASLYARMKAAPAAVDLAGLWRDLGVVGGRLDDRAPLAAVRRAILA